MLHKMNNLNKIIVRLKLKIKLKIKILFVCLFSVKAFCANIIFCCIWEIFTGASLLRVSFGSEENIWIDFKGMLRPILCIDINTHSGREKNYVKLILKNYF